MSNSNDLLAALLKGAASGAGSAVNSAAWRKKSGCLSFKRILTFIAIVLLILLVLKWLGYCDAQDASTGIDSYAGNAEQGETVSEEPSGGLLDGLFGTPSTETTESPYATKPVATVPPEVSPASTAQPYASPALSVTEAGEYTDRDSVALYIHTYGKLPGNFITKSQAEDLGWVNSLGNLNEVAPGKSIGGSRFGNYEGLLPDGHTYYECDINYNGGFRGGERIVYSTDGLIFYTGDHYDSFTQLY